MVALQDVNAAIKEVRRARGSNWVCRRNDADQRA